MSSTLPAEEPPPGAHTGPPSNPAEIGLEPQDAAPARLRICFVSETLHAGVGRHLVELISLLAARGHAIHLLYSPVRVDAAFLEEIRAQPNVTCHAIHMSRAVGPRDLRAFFELRRYVAQNGPFDVVHGHSSKGGALARLLRLFGATPVVYTPHAFVTMSPVISPIKRLIYGVIEAGLARLSSRIVCVSAFEAEHARRLSISPKRLVVIVIGADPHSPSDREGARRELGLNPDAIVAGYTGRMDTQKGPDRFVAAAERLADRTDLHFVLVGDGPLRTELEARMAAAGLAERTHWRDFGAGRHLIDGFDIYVLPSLYEGFARVLIEALIAGLPIVTTPVGGALETVEPEANGFIVPQDDVQAMSSAILRLAGDPALRSSMAAASRQKAPSFSVATMVRRVEALYFELVRDPGAVRSRRG